MFDTVKEPEDIFSETDPVRPAAASGRGNEAQPSMVVKAGPSPWLFIAIAAVVFGALGGGGYYWWSTRVRQAMTEKPAMTDDTVGNPEATGSETAQPTSPAETTEASGQATDGTSPPVTTQLPDGQPASQPESTSAIDTDGDGLPDDEEAQVGSDPLIADTDGDGLSDFDEVRIYKTDPTNPDTDGDGYTDGQEVKSGYNPNGDGRLFQVPQ